MLLKRNINVLETRTDAVILSLPLLLVSKVRMRFYVFDVDFCDLIIRHTKHGILLIL